MYHYASFQPKRSWAGYIKIVGIFLGAVGVIGLIAIMQFRNAAWGRKPANSAAAVTVTVAEGETFTEVTKDIEAQNLASSFWLRTYVKLFDDPSIYPGNYTFVIGQNYQSIMTELHGHSLSAVRITIPEGFTLAKMGERIRAAIPSISIEQWNAATGVKSPFASDPFVIASGKPTGVDLEGYLFPDTYEFATDATAEDIVKTMLETMKGHIDDIGTVTGDAAGMTMHQVLTLASIVEKEVRTADTMKNVADIFLKRISIGMALQSDATINYIIDGDNPSPTYEDLEVDSPYNTYKNPGLPPGPISSPGLNALSAVLHPTHNDYYYFLTTDDGAIYYAATYEEHLRNKAKWLK